jgi:ATP-binding cassette subfamily B multidrug efflux pump
MQAGEAVESAVNPAIDAVWYAGIFVIVAAVVMAGLDWTLLVPVGVWLLLYGILFSITMPLIAHYSETLSEAKSVMTGRIVDSYTNIQTLKAFSTGGHEDKYVADSVLDHVVEYRKLMKVFTLMWSTLFVLNAALVVSTTWLALDGWNRGGGDGDPVRAADHEHVGLDPRDGLNDLPASRQHPGLDGDHRPADYHAGRAQCPAAQGG